MSSTPSDDTAHDDIPVEIDFSIGTRGQFFDAKASVLLPVDLDAAKHIAPPAVDR